MQRAHSSFGSHYNRKNNRKGKVAIDRPQTPVVEEDSYAQIDVHMYIEANPLRAGMVRNLSQLKNCRYSSYQYYAHGIENNFTKGLSIPSWYLLLGDSALIRQKAYRELFKEYLQRNGWIGKAGGRTQKEELSREVESKHFMKDTGSIHFLKNREAFHVKYKFEKEKDRELPPEKILQQLLDAD